jgi:hypothetical protein
MNENRPYPPPASTPPGGDVGDPTVYLDAFLQAIDYRDPTALRSAAGEIQGAIDRTDELIRQKVTELGKMRFALQGLIRVRDQLNREADYLRRQVDFDTANSGQIKARRPTNPEVTP